MKKKLVAVTGDFPPHRIDVTEQTTILEGFALKLTSSGDLQPIRLAEALTGAEPFKSAEAYVLLDDRPQAKGLMAGLFFLASGNAEILLRQPIVRPGLGISPKMIMNVRFGEIDLAETFPEELACSVGTGKPQLWIRRRLTDAILYLSSELIKSQPMAIDLLATDSHSRLKRPCKKNRGTVIKWHWDEPKAFERRHMDAEYVASRKIGQIKLFFAPRGQRPGQLQDQSRALGQLRYEILPVRSTH